MKDTYEAFLQKRIFPDLEKGRPGWDKPHTVAVVEYVKEIIRSENLDESMMNVLIIAAYLHDWGYTGLFEGSKGAQLDEVKNAKALHMDRGAAKVRELLREKEFDFLTSDQKQRVVHLVFVHDKLDKIRELDECILMEADTLAGLDVAKVTPTYNKESNERYMNGVLQNRRPKFVTSYSKETFEEIFAKRKEYYGE